MKNLILVFTVLFSLNLFASDEHSEGPCKADREKLCPGIEKGEGRIRKCMHDNMEKVSAECKAKWEENKEKREHMKDDCTADREKFCKDVKPGKGGIIKCLKENEASLSATCRDSISHLKKKKK